MTGEQRHCKLHAIVFPFPVQGHITPAVNLALKLASKGITVTFVQLEIVHRMLSKAQNHTAGELDLFSEAQQSGLDIRYTTLGDGLPLDYSRESFDAFLEVLLYTNYPECVDEFIRKTIKRDPNLVPFIVADTSLVWLTKVAKKHCLMSASFWTEPALGMCLVRHLDLLKEHGHFPCKDELEEDISYVPGVDPINTRDIKPCYKESLSGTVISRALTDMYEALQEADFVLYNTVQELESETLSVLNKFQPNYAVGPVNFSTTLASTVTKSLLSESDCTQWLSSKPPGSVLYVSFGSAVQIDKHVIQEIANGLLLSEVNFIWVVRPDLVSNLDNNGILPNGFHDDVKDRGLMVPWCNQIKVLSDPAVQGFLTHCGWNSVVESIWCSVPMLCYPVSFDHPTNRKLVVEKWKVGIDLCDEKSVCREKVAQKINNLMTGTIAEGLKQEMKKVSTTFHHAMEVGGSSENNVDKFIQDLKDKITSMSSDAYANF